MSLHLRRSMVCWFLVLLAACGVADTGQVVTTTIVPAPSSVPITTPAATARSDPTAAPESTVAPTLAATPIIDGVLVIYRKTGGIAGIDEILAVYADGTLQLTSRKAKRTAKVDAATLAALKQILNDPEFAALKSPPAVMGADMFEYNLTIPATGQTMRTLDGADNPPLLNAAIQQLNELRKMVDTQ